MIHFKVECKTCEMIEERETEGVILISVKDVKRAETGGSLEMETFIHDVNPVLALVAIKHLQGKLMKDLSKQIDQLLNEHEDSI